MLVDGSLLSNLPIFLVPYLKLPAELPILCFRLNAKRRSRPKHPRSAFSMIKELIDTAISGSTEVQLSMGQSRQVITIQTGDIGPTDLHINREQVKDLITAGKTAVEDFVDQEQLLVTGLGSFDSPVRGGYRQDLLERTVQVIRASSGPLCISAGDMSWLKELHISLLLAVRSGRQVRILYDVADNPAVAEAARGAAAVGASVVQARSLFPLKGTMVNPRSESAVLIAVEKLGEPFGRVLSAPADRGLLTLAIDAFEAAWEQGTLKSDAKTPSIKRILDTELLAALRRVTQYNDLDMSVEWLPPSQLLPLACYLEFLKLSRVADVEKVLSDVGLDNAARIDGSPWPITPPVVERLRGGQLVIIDGTHRVYHALQNGQQRIRVIVVENSGRALPAQPLDSWTRVQVTPGTVSREERYHNYNEAEFRRISDAFSVLAV